MRFILQRASLLLVFALMASASLLAQYTVSGSVTDGDGEPLIGVSILVVGTTTGTVSDIAGKFVVNLPDGISPQS